ncbi:hypothetical protein [Sporocytophaga myxococcoides]|uniref:hypothetical protein n=1 Tax=Sporocytophaga myxococcoides TaxID=153721 RepID=UPI00040C5F42|nr:hypothetical protein [Sporocytophaga myxococcoides]
MLCITLDELNEQLFTSAQDGEKFDRLRKNDKFKFWQFDYALIPLSLRHLYNNVPFIYKAVLNVNVLDAFYKGRWKKKSSV